jgi:hypothetical protein
MVLVFGSTPATGDSMSFQSKYHRPWAHTSLQSFHSPNGAVASYLNDVLLRPGGGGGVCGGRGGEAVVVV